MTDLLAFNDLIKSYPNVPYEQIPPNHPLHMLVQVTRADKIIKITDDIPVNGEYKPTANSLAVILDDPNGQSQNLLIYSSNKTFILNTNISGITIGKGNGDLFIVDTPQNGIDLHLDLTAKNHDHTIVISPIPSFFNGLINDFSTKKQVNVFCSLTEKDQYLQLFRGKNVRLISLIDPFYNDYLYQYSSFADFLADKDITAIECGIEWGKLGQLREIVKQSALPFPLDNFPEILKNAIIAIADKAQVTLPIGSMSVLGAVTAIAQRTVSARFTHSTRPVSLFLLTEAESSAGKSFALEYSYYAIDKWLINQKLKYKIEREEWQKQLEKLQGAEKYQFLQDNPPPINPYFVSEDATIESLFHKFVAKGNKDLVWRSDDAGIIFGGHSFKSDRKANVLGNLASIWSKQTATRLRTATTDNNEANEIEYFCNLTMDLMGQNVILEPILSDPLFSGQGFLARFLFMKSDDNRGNRQWNNLDRLNDSPYQDKRLLDYWQLCDKLLDPLPALYPRNHIVTQDHRFIIEYANADVLKYHADYQQRCEEEQQNGKLYQFDKEIAGRMAENACRIATIFAFCEQRTTTTIQDYKNACAIVDYCMFERLRYFKEVQSSQKSEPELMLDWLIKYCKDNQTAQIGQRTLMQKVTPKKLRPKDEFWQNLNFLAENNYLHINSSDKTIKVNPILLA